MTAARRDDLRGFVAWVSSGLMWRVSLVALVALAGCNGKESALDGGGPVAADAGGDPTDAGPSPTDGGSGGDAGVFWLWGLTTDDALTNTAAQVGALRALPRRVMLRVVFDPPAAGGPYAADYAPAVNSLSQVADVMGLPLDSSAMSAFTPAQVQARVTEYLQAMGGTVSVWEIGNELNGNWLGANAIGKTEVMFDAVKAAGKKTALTLYYENPQTPGYELVSWVDANIPAGHRMRAGLDYVLVSYYEDQNLGHQLSQAELDQLFAALAARFPSAHLGFGEFGWGGTLPSSDATRETLLRRFMGYRVPSVPAFVGGGFYWHFNVTMVPQTKPDWAVMSSILQP